jgi:hypothetical protein
MLLWITDDFIQKEKYDKTAELNLTFEILWINLNPCLFRYKVSFCKIFHHLSEKIKLNQNIINKIKHITRIIKE